MAISKTRKEPTKLDVDKCEIVEIEFDADVSDSDLLPNWNIANGTPVSVNEVPFPCEYQDGRIVPTVMATAGSMDDRFRPPELPFATLALGFGVLLLTGGAFYAWRRS